MRLGELQRDYLQQNQLEVRWKKDGRTIETEIEDFRPDIIVLDLDLPGIHGIDICKKIRNEYLGQIIVLTASDDDIDHVTCLEIGADDFLSKPINPRVLLARIRNSLNKAFRSGNAPEDATTIHIGSLAINKVCQTALINKEPLSLTDSEFKLLWLLAQTPDAAVERAQLFKEIRGIDFDGVDRSVDTKIVSLRKKIDDNDASKPRIVTVRNKGYLLSSDGWK